MTLLMLPPATVLSTVPTLLIADSQSVWGDGEAATVDFVIAIPFTL